jgi:SAM-dependent methyltransferase
LDWVRTFYDKQDEWAGIFRGGIDAFHRERAFWVDRALEGRVGRVLELGCGGGQTAAAIAEMGHTVVAVDLNPRAIEIAKRRAKGRFEGRMRPVLADFFEVELEGTFDGVCYFDGFGVGEDDDQRRILRRIAAWLNPAGVALIDVYTPWYWAAASGRTMEFGDASRRYAFDAEAGRMLDTWWPTGRPGEAVTQSLRCYGPADLRLLAQGTDLELLDVQPGGAVDEETGEYCHQAPLEDAMSFLATLGRVDSQDD